MSSKEEHLFEAQRGVEHMVRGICGEIPSGMIETPERVIRMYREMTSGYSVDVSTLFKTFEEDGSQDMVIVRDIEFVSLCEHHLVVFEGKATVGYIPSGRVVGLSKIARLVQAYSRRFQLQERLTKQIASAMMENLDPQGVGVIVSARHLCMCARGARARGSETVTSSMKGVFLESPSTRDEFLRLSGK